MYKYILKNSAFLKIKSRFQMNLHIMDHSMFCTILEKKRTKYGYIVCRSHHIHQIIIRVKTANVYSIKEGSSRKGTSVHIPPINNVQHIFADTYLLYSRSHCKPQVNYFPPEHGQILEQLELNEETFFIPLVACVDQNAPVIFFFL